MSAAVEPEGCPQPLRSGGSILEKIVHALCSPDAYPHPVADIEVIQTHISYVFLAGDLAYKVKKPLALEFLDYSTLPLRKHMCEEEVRLNRRLCEGVYLGVVPITGDGNGYKVSGGGEAVEYAVAMRRIPHERMLDVMIQKDLAGLARVVHDVGELIALFHQQEGSSVENVQYGLPPALLRNWKANLVQLRSPTTGSPFDVNVLQTLSDFGPRFIVEQEKLLIERADNGRIRDCHGDLRADSVFVRQDGRICILDCIEFSDRIRFGDVAGDIGFLAMDLEYRERQDLADELMAAYLSAAPDETLPIVLPYYKVYRAIVRAKVETMRSLEAEVPDPARTQSREAAARYLRLALDYVASARRPVLVYMIGLSGTGKSFLSNALACRIHAAIISSDAVRKTGSPIAVDMYSTDARERVYTELRQRAASHLAAGRSVILDATHISRDQREAVRELARVHSVPVLGVVVSLDEAAVRTRLLARAERGLSPSDASWDVYVEQRKAFNPVGIEEGPVVRLSGDVRPTQAVAAVLDVLGS